VVKQGTFDGLPPDEIIRRIEKALAHGGNTHTWDDIRQGLIEGKYQIFWNPFGACITEIVDAPQKRYLNCFVVAGQLPEVMELQDEVDKFALIHNCAYMMTSARMGWQKVLPDYGWKAVRTVFIKDVEGY
jgi:hypothetical protein